MLVNSGLFLEFNRVSFLWISPVLVTWSPSNRRFELNPKAFLVGAIINFFVSASLLQHSILAWASQKIYGTQADSYNNIVFILGACFFLVSVTSGQIARRPELFLDLFNQFVRFELENPSAKKHKWDWTESRKHLRYAKLVCAAIRISTVIFLPVISAAVSLYLPEFPTNILHYVPFHFRFPETSMFSSFWKIFTFVSTLIVWFTCEKFWVTYLFRIIIGCTGMILSILRFQLRFREEIAASGSELGWLLSYRQLQLLSGLHNQLESKVLIFLCLATGGAQVLFGYNVLCGGHGLWVWILNVICFLNGMVGVFFIFGFCSRVYKTSTKCLKRMRYVEGFFGGGRRRRYSEMKRDQKLIKSCRILKANFGGNNFVDRLTPVKFQNFATLRLVNYLLVSKK